MDWGELCRRGPIPYILSWLQSVLQTFPFTRNKEPGGITELEEITSNGSRTFSSLKWGVT